MLRFILFETAIENIFLHVIRKCQNKVLFNLMKMSFLKPILSPHVSVC